MNPTFTIIALSLLIFGCKSQESIIDNEPNLFNRESFNKTNADLVAFNLMHEPNLLEIINSFRLKNKNAELEDVVIQDFLALQRCNTDEGTQFQDYPNELQSIFDFYGSMNKEDMEWLNGKDLKILKFSAVRFVLKHVNDAEAVEYLKIVLNDCKLNNRYTGFLMGGSNLGDCAEKRM